MCQHCCRMEWTPCAPIPYACPLCPVRQLSDRCHGPNRGDYKLLYPYPSPNRKPIKHTDLCKDISELYSYVVAAKTNVKRGNKRRGNTANQASGDKQLRMLSTSAWHQKQQQLHLEKARNQANRRNEINCDIPAPYMDPIQEEDTWTWKSRYPVPEKVLPVRARLAPSGAKRARSEQTDSSAQHTLQAHLSNVQ